MEGPALLPTLTLPHHNCDLGRVVESFLFFREDKRDRREAPAHTTRQFVLSLGICGILPS